MAAGTPAWPSVDPDAIKRAAAKNVLQEALVDVLGYDTVGAGPSGGSAAEAVATALLGALGGGRWSLRTGAGKAEILGQL